MMSARDKRDKKPIYERLYAMGKNSHGKDYLIKRDKKKKHP